MLKITNYI